MLKLFLFITLALFVSMASTAPVVNLYDFELQSSDERQKSKFDSLPAGLHLIEPPNGDHDTMLVAVHGQTARQDDWIETLKTVDNETTKTYFFRWDTKDCPTESAKELLADVLAIIDKSPKLGRIVFIGRDWGGLVLTQLLSKWQVTIACDVHLVATPLAALDDLFDSNNCEMSLPKRIQPTVRLFHWKVREVAGDSFFKKFDTDPQELDIDGSLSITLPASYENELITHATSLKWVARRISENLHTNQSVD
ncbi:MAG: alpha/beta hydrolase [Gammaproteobacteria bacterium]|nr:alpha/beta hydrolase [Gammaproteobacteria bacterium]